MHGDVLLSRLVSPFHPQCCLDAEIKLYSEQWMDITAGLFVFVSFKITPFLRCDQNQLPLNRDQWQGAQMTGNARWSLEKGRAHQGTRKPTFSGFRAFINFKFPASVFRKTEVGPGGGPSPTKWVRHLVTLISGHISPKLLISLI